MNLIEQLGGYDRAKKLVDDCKRYGRSDVKVPVNGGFIHIVADFLELDLLEYRRQHNIYETGDKVVFTDKYSNNILLTITELTCSYAFTSMEFGEIGSDSARHATNAEIKAGRRL